jgi:hypothetical protein
MTGGLMESRAQQFRAKALQCLHAAQSATDLQAKASFLELAQRWRELAEQVEILDRERPKP